MAETGVATVLQCLNTGRSIMNVIKQKAWAVLLMLTASKEIYAGEEYSKSEPNGPSSTSNSESKISNGHPNWLFLKIVEELNAANDSCDYLDSRYDATTLPSAYIQIYDNSVGGSSAYIQGGYVAAESVGFDRNADIAKSFGASWSDSLQVTYRGITVTVNNLDISLGNLPINKSSISRELRQFSGSADVRYTDGQQDYAQQFEWDSLRVELYEQGEAVRLYAEQNKGSSESDGWFILSGKLSPPASDGDVVDFWLRLDTKLPASYNSQCGS